MCVSIAVAGFVSIMVAKQHDQTYQQKKQYPHTHNEQDRSAVASVTMAAANGAMSMVLPKLLFAFWTIVHNHQPFPIKI